MSYRPDTPEDVEQNFRDRIQDLEERMLSSDVVSIQRTGSSESGRGIDTFREPEGGEVVDLGTQTGAFEIDLSSFSNRGLAINASGDLTLTFINIPVDYHSNLRVYTQVNEPIITVAGVIVTGTGSVHNTSSFGINDFLDISIFSTDEINVLIKTVKKNDEDSIPNLVGNVTDSNHTDTSMTISWDTPTEGSSPIQYDLEYSLSSAETNGVPDTPITDATTKNLDNNFVNINGLSPFTTYWIWVRAKNNFSEGDYIGPLQTITEPTPNAGNINFTLTATAFDTIQASWTQPTGKTLKFDFWRDFPTTGVLNPIDEDEKVVENSQPASGNSDTYDDIFLEPNRQYFYALQVKNGAGQIIATIFGSATTPVLPTPVFTLTSPARRMKTDITFPPRMSIVYVEVATDSGFTNIVDTKQHSRSISGDWDTSEDEEFESISLNPLTLYYVRARFEKNQSLGPNSASQNSTTGSLLDPSQPTLTMTSPSTGVVRIKVRFNDDPTRDETAVVTWRLQSSINEFFSFPGNVYVRNSQQNGLMPPDDLDDREDRIEVLRTGGWPNGVLLSFRCQLSNLAGDSIADTDDVTVDT